MSVVIIKNYGMQDERSSKPVTHSFSPVNVGSLCNRSSSSTFVSPPCSHDALIASIQLGRTHFTSDRSLATNLYFGVSVSPTIRWVTSEVRSSLWTAPICDAIAARSACTKGYIRQLLLRKFITLNAASNWNTYALLWWNGCAAKDSAQKGQLIVCHFPT